MWERVLPGHKAQGGARGLEQQQQLVVAEEMDEGWTYPRELQWWPLCVLLWNYSECRKSEYVGIGIRKSNLGEVLRELQE